MLNYDCSREIFDDKVAFEKQIAERMEIEKTEYIRYDIPGKVLRGYISNVNRNRKTDYDFRNDKKFQFSETDNLNFTCSLVCDEVKIENVKSVLQDFIKRHSLVGFDVK